MRERQDATGKAGQNVRDSDERQMTMAGKGVQGGPRQCRSHKRGEPIQAANRPVRSEAVAHRDHNEE